MRYQESEEKRRKLQFIGYRVSEWKIDNSGNNCWHCLQTYHCSDKINCAVYKNKMTNLLPSQDILKVISGMFK